MTNKPENGYWNIYNVDHSGFAGRFVGNFHKNLEAAQEAAKEECRMEPKTKHITRMYGSKRSYLADKKLNTVGLQGEYGYYNGYAFTDADGKRKNIRGFFYKNQKDCERASEAVAVNSSFILSSVRFGLSRGSYARAVAEESNQLCYPERMQAAIRELESKGFDMSETPEENKQTVRGLEDERKHLMKKTKTELVEELIMNAELNESRKQAMEKYQRELAAAKSELEEHKQTIKNLEGCISDLNHARDRIDEDLTDRTNELEYVSQAWRELKEAFDVLTLSQRTLCAVIQERRHPAQIVPEATSFMPAFKTEER